MKILIAKNIGFCSGVKRAIDIAEKAMLKDKKPIQFLGSLVHNEIVIQKFKKRGARFLKNPKESKSGTLIIQAHGFSPFKINKNVLIRDATCPLVKKTQVLANFLFKKGYKVVIVGDKNHSEVKGINGYIKNKGIVIENESQAKKLPKLKKIGVVCQTTKGIDKFNKIIKILKNKADEIKWFNTLCPEVNARQKELDKILRISNGVLVIGSRSSANTKKLVEKIKKTKKRFIWINSLEELRNKNLKGISTLGAVSGTSTPNWEIEKIKNHLEKAKRSSSSSSPSLS